MYSNSTVSGAVLGGGAAALPFTGLSLNLLWFVLAAFALMSAGGALLRVAPSLHAQPTRPVRRVTPRSTVRR